MIAEKPYTEPSMDEILASIRKIISADAQDETPSEAPSYFPHKSDDILDLTEPLPEEHGHTPTMSSEFHVNDLGEWSPMADKAVHFEEIEKNLYDEREKAPIYGATTISSFEDSLVSPSTISEATNAFHLLDKLAKETPRSSASPSSEGMGGQTLEALMREMLKPLLREWLDAHLPSLVRSVVTEQAEKIVGQAGRKAS